MEAYMFGNYPATKYGWDYDVLRGLRKDRYFVYHHLDKIQPGDVAAVYSFVHQAFVAVALITSRRYRDQDWFVDWNLYVLPRRQWIRRAALQGLKAWKDRKPFVTDDSGKLNPQFANPVLITGGRWDSIWALLPQEARQHLDGKTPKESRRRGGSGARQTGRAAADARMARIRKRIGPTQRYGDDT